MADEIKRAEVKRYNWPKQEEENLKNLVHKMYDNGLNVAEIRSDFIIMLSIALYELEIEIGME